MTKLKKAWIAPFPTSQGKNSGMCSIAMRVDKEEDKFPLKLVKHVDFSELKEKKRSSLSVISFG